MEIKIIKIKIDFWELNFIYFFYFDALRYDKIILINKILLSKINILGLLRVVIYLFIIYKFLIL